MSIGFIQSSGILHLLPLEKTMRATWKKAMDFHRERRIKRCRKAKVRKEIRATEVLRHKWRCSGVRSVRGALLSFDNRQGFWSGEDWRAKEQGKRARKTEERRYIVPQRSRWYQTKVRRRRLWRWRFLMARRSAWSSSRRAKGERLWSWHDKVKARTYVPIRAEGSRKETRR